MDRKLFLKAEEMLNQFLEESYQVSIERCCNDAVKIPFGISIFLRGEDEVLSILNLLREQFLFVQEMFESLGQNGDGIPKDFALMALPMIKKYVQRVRMDIAGWKNYYPELAFASILEADKTTNINLLIKKWSAYVGACGYNLSKKESLKNLDKLLKRGCKAKILEDNVPNIFVVINFDALTERRLIDADRFVASDPGQISLLYNLRAVFERTTELDANEYFLRVRDFLKRYDLDGIDKMECLQVFSDYGVSTNDLSEIVSTEEMIEYLEFFLQNDPEFVLSVSSVFEAAEKKDKDKVEIARLLLRYGYDIRDIIKCFVRKGELKEYLEFFLEYEPAVGLVLESLEPAEIPDNFEILQKHGVQIDIRQLFGRLSRIEVLENSDFLLQHGIERELIVQRLLDA